MEMDVGGTGALQGRDLYRTKPVPHQVGGISLPMPEIPSTRSLAPLCQLVSMVHGPSTRQDQTSHLAVKHLATTSGSPKVSLAPRSDSPEVLQAPTRGTSIVHVQTLQKSTAPDKFSGTDKHQDLVA
jgi:hypothetical protein